MVGEQSIDPHQYFFAQGLGTVSLYLANICQQRSRNLARSRMQFAGHSAQEIQKKEYHFGKADGLNKGVVRDTGNIQLL